MLPYIFYSPSADKHLQLDDSSNMLTPPSSASSDHNRRSETKFDFDHDNLPDEYQSLPPSNQQSRNSSHLSDDVIENKPFYKKGGGSKK